MKRLTMKITEADFVDCKDIFEWRIDPLSRTMSQDTKFISYEEHLKWFNDSLFNRQRKLYIGMIRHAKVGICRFDHDVVTNSVAVSINLNPEARGKKLSYELLKCAISKYREINSADLKATIRIENQISIKIFSRLGFEEIDRTTKFLFLQYKT